MLEGKIPSLSLTRHRGNAQRIDIFAQDWHSGHMFLIYRNQGERRYGRAPIQPYPRKVWEFQFFWDGQCSLLVTKDGKQHSERILRPTLVVSGPDCIHGWGGKLEDRCQNMIFHFDEAEYAVRSIVGTQGFRKIPFRESEIPVLQMLYERCGEARKTIGTTPLEVQKRAGLLEPLIYRIVATELTLLFLKHVPKSEWGTPPNYELTKVNEAMAWFEANLSTGPQITDVARAIHISPTHLRRLFHKIRACSPQQEFTRVQFDRAKWLMRDPEMTFEQISANTGFGSSSAFSRAFKAKFHCSPREFRQKPRIS